MRNSGTSDADGAVADQNLRELLARRKKLEKLMVRQKSRKKWVSEFNNHKAAPGEAALHRNCLTALVTDRSNATGAYTGDNFIALNT